MGDSWSGPVKQDWRNRNRIKTPWGTRWLTVPCGSHGRRLINQVELPDPRWQHDHWEAISRAYSRTPFFAEYRDFFAELYLGKQWERLAEMNRAFVTGICRELLGVETRFRDSTDYDLHGAKTDRLLDLLGQEGAAVYLTGPTARNYLDEHAFRDQGVDVEWMDYGGYEEYAQLFPPFEHGVTVLDLIFNEGPNARNLLKSSA